MNEQVTINSLEFAKKSLEIHGTITSFALTRLGEWLHSGEESLNYRLRGFIGAQGSPQLALEVRGDLKLVCQRCLGPVAFKIDAKNNFILVPNEADLPPPEQDLDDKDYLVADPHLQVEWLVEEEVLLALPLAPRHSGVDCSAALSGSWGCKDNPFSALKGMMINKR